MQPTHLAFGDESKWNQGRFRGVGIVTLEVRRLKEIETAIKETMAESGVREIKYQAIKGARDRFAASKIISLIVEKAFLGHCRVDVLSWDIEDSRHKVIGRDDSENLLRMYHHCLNATLEKKWGNQDAVWKICLDEHSAISAEMIKHFLQQKADRHEEHRLGGLLPLGEDFNRLFEGHRISEVHQGNSGAEVLVQVADLFVGLGVWTRDPGCSYRNWRNNQPTDQIQLFEEQPVEFNASTALKAKFEVLHTLVSECQARKMGLSINTKDALHTPNGQRPVNFWHYEAQSIEDQAPVKGMKRAD